VLLDDREQIAQEPPLDLGQLGAGYSRTPARGFDLVDRRAGRRQDGQPALAALISGAVRARAAVAVAGRGARRGPGPAQPLGRGFALL
jgi:hypothetical protein